MKELYAEIDKIAAMQADEIKRVIHDETISALEALRHLFGNRFAYDSYYRLLPVIRGNKAVLDYCADLMVSTNMPFLVSIIERGNADGSWNCEYPKEIASFILQGFSSMVGVYDTPLEEEPRIQAIMNIVAKMLDGVNRNEVSFARQQPSDSAISASHDAKCRSIEARPLRMAKEYIEQHYSESVTLDVIAQYVGLNPSYLSTLFRTEGGGNFLEYLTKVRIRKAKDLLSSTNKTVASICTQVGYKDPKHFFKVFKRITGHKPSEYRNMFA